MTTVTRFPPSPTGYLHVGGARTALFSWLYAKKHHGKFILRIEDTDLERSSDAAVQAILDGMAWLGLDYDAGPFYQTHRFDRYQEVIDQLLDSGHAYYCYCTKGELDAMREQQMASKEMPRYNQKCRDLTTPPRDRTEKVIRFKNPLNGNVVWEDMVKGEIRISNSELDDFIIARSDGTPTYNLTVVVDDWDMKITHVIRGDDHVSNTPKQINIFKALGATIPHYGHVPMILGDDGKRLSKRHGAVSVMQYRDDGFLPEALLNYLVRLGWSHGDEEIFSIKEMIHKFDIEHISRSPAAFNTKKLLWLNQHYMKTQPVEEVAMALNYQFKHLHVNTDNGPSLENIIPVMAERVETLKAMAEQTRCYFEDDIQLDAKAAKKWLKQASIEPLQLAHDQFEQLGDWHAGNLHFIAEEVAETLGLGMGKVGMPLRVAVTGSSNSPDLGITLEWVGKERTLKRIEDVIKRLS